MTTPKKLPPYMDEVRAGRAKLNVTDLRKWFDGWIFRGVNERLKLHENLGITLDQHKAMINSVADEPEDKIMKGYIKYLKELV